jgi:signal transduction histidine kinase
VICWLDQFRYSPFLYLIVLLLSCLYFGDVASYVLGLLVWVVYIVKHFLYSSIWLSDGTERHYLVLFTIGSIFAITIARMVVREQASRARSEELLAELGHSHRQLQGYAGQVAELATTRERNRLAREIHDSLGHYLTVINVQLEKALVLRAKKPQEADRAVSDAKLLAGEALQDVRRSVSALRTTSKLPALFPSLTTLVERVQSEQTPIALHIEGNEAGYSPQGLLTLYRAAQEGLTNIQKHAGASQVWVDLKLEQREAILRLRDNGCGFDAARLQQEGYEQGYGLRGIQERLELVGGSLKIESVPSQGTTLLVRIPGNDTQSVRVASLP